MERGSSIFNALEASFLEHDPGASAHWNLQHADFSYQDGNFSGLRGFGGHRPPYTGVRHAIHRVLQHRFRRLCKHIGRFNELDTLAGKITWKQGRAYDLDVLRQTLSLAWLDQRLPPTVLGPKSSVCVIGDGFGSMTAMLEASNLAGTIVLVNLTRTLLVDLHFLRLWLGPDRFDDEVYLATSMADIESLLDMEPSTCRIIAIQAENHALLQSLSINLVLNIVSMGEMEPSTIAAYFDDIRSMSSPGPLYFYCCNRTEKRLPDGILTRFAEYPWIDNDRILVDELCPWHQFYYSARFPFYHKYDGPVQHRLALMAAA